MREFNKKNSEKLFLLKVCLPTVYEEIGDERVEAVEQGWAKEQDYKFINGLVQKYVVQATEKLLYFEGSMQEKMELIRTFNYFLYAFVERKNPKTLEELEAIIKEYYVNVKDSVKLGG